MPFTVYELVNPWPGLGTKGVEVSRGGICRIPNQPETWSRMRVGFRIHAKTNVSAPLTGGQRLMAGFCNYAGGPPVVGVGSHFAGFANVISGTLGTFTNTSPPRLAFDLSSATNSLKFSKIEDGALSQADLVNTGKSGDQEGWNIGVQQSDLSSDGFALSVIEIRRTGENLFELEMLRHSASGTSTTSAYQTTDETLRMWVLSELPLGSLTPLAGLTICNTGEVELREDLYGKLNAFGVSWSFEPVPIVVGSVYVNVVEV